MIAPYAAVFVLRRAVVQFLAMKPGGTGSVRFLIDVNFPPRIIYPLFFARIASVCCAAIDSTADPAATAS
jgi:hypothetical protein